MKRYLLYLFLIKLLVSNAAYLWASNTLQSPPTQHQFQRDFKEKYSGKKYNYEGDDAIEQNLYPVDREYSEYEDIEPTFSEDNNDTESSFNLSIINYMFIFALVAAVVYLLYVLFNEGSSGLFGSRNAQKINNYGGISSETIESTDVQSLIDQAENNNDFRLAIRYYYILVLKTLSVKKLIVFEDDKTDSEYQNEIVHLKFGNQFARTSYLYNYIWYGEFPLNLEQYYVARESFQGLLNEVK